MTEHRPTGASARPVPTAPVLTVAGITVAFAATGARRPGPPREVVHGVGFTLERGRVLALVGESGSGKSVTAMALLSLLPRNARVGGSGVLTDGDVAEELVGAPADRLQAVRGRRIAAIFQEPMSALNPVFRIGDQIAEAVQVHQPHLGADATRARVLELLEQVSVREPRRIARAYPHEVSGGQLQRAMIAMAVSNDPAVLIADEPTTALDVTVQAGILGLLRDLTDRLGTAVLLITHDMGVVADVADDVAVMREGRIVESAPAEQLFAAPAADYTRALLQAVPRITDVAPDPRSDLTPRAEPGPRADAEPDPRADAEPGPRSLSSSKGPSTSSANGLAAELRDASVVYGGRGGEVRAVDQVSLTVAPGEFLGLVGESGSGKSTVGRALAGLVPVRSGEAWLAGVELSGASRAELRRARSRLGIVFQDPASSLNPRHSVGRSIAEPLVLHGTTDPAVRRARVEELLDRVRLSRDLAGRLPHELSGGQRQRVALARALVDRPALLIADEPTSALDVSVQATVLELLAELQRDLGFACLFISHDLAVVSTVTSRVAVMYDGRVVETGRTAEVLRSPQDPYSRRLLAAVPVADPVEQRERRRAWLELEPAAR
ncbi:peptide/nickel transport system ATP-binding protein [Friedmanniella luteola]|uniref:Peptide/nickel transport system ATP-binding protein n=1 Tax=Friedmanniella luteola TaxID=546871 RepID=A0A1H1SR14_9ACTN|nr:ABC transporter ATP-binding protein [Friedmanniella luteola]SDS50424.1 peptide/nickel transport system ATP-binding protein [Friedmanniella luteola]